MNDQIPRILPFQRFDLLGGQGIEAIGESWELVKVLDDRAHPEKEQWATQDCQNRFAFSGTQYNWQVWNHKGGQHYLVNIGRQVMMEEQGPVVKEEREVVEEVAAQEDFPRVGELFPRVLGDIVAGSSAA